MPTVKGYSMHSDCACCARQKTLLWPNESMDKNKSLNTNTIIANVRLL